MTYYLNYLHGRMVNNRPWPILTAITRREAPTIDLGDISTALRMVRRAAEGGLIWSVFNAIEDGGIGHIFKSMLLDRYEIFVGGVYLLARQSKLPDRHYGFDVWEAWCNEMQVRAANKDSVLAMIAQVASEFDDRLGKLVHSASFDKQPI